MIINDSIFTEKGDEIIFQTVPLFGLQGFTSISESITGTTDILYFERFFQFSLDGVVFMDWIEFDGQSSLLEQNITPKLTGKTEPVIRFKYIRSGSDISANELIFNGITIVGKYLQPTPIYNTANKTIFKDLVYDNIDVYNLMVNLTNKLYSEGIVPNFMVRNQKQGDIEEDKDYIEFWATVSKFFALIFIHASKFRNIFWRRKLLAEFLDQKGIFITDRDDIITMQLLASNFFDEIRQRGTADIFRKKMEQIVVGRRILYTLPDGFIISPSTPLYIDGVAYEEANQLPFGWLISGNELIAPDLNYHSIAISLTIDINGDFNEDFNTDFLIDYNSPGVVLLPATPNSGLYKDYDGEYLRLIGYNDKTDEFIYNQVNIKNLGWNLNNSSPLYRGLRIHDNKSILKSYEPDTSDFVNLNNYPIL